MVNRKSLIFLFTLFPLICSPVYSIDQTTVVKSPDGRVSVEIGIGADLRLYYKVARDNKEVIQTSNFGVISDNIDLGKEISFGPVEKRTIKESYSIYGVHSEAVNSCNEVTITIQAKGDKWFLDVRAYNDGAALRSRLPARKGRHILLTEANLIDYTDLAVKSAGDRSFKAFFHAEPEGWKTDKEVIQPWRTTIIAGDLNSFVNSDLIRNLCPSPFPDVINSEWIKPGRAGWNWWSTPTLIYEQQQQWVDWTQQLGFEYYLIDAGWTKWKEGAKNAWDCIAETVKYGKSKGVDIWIWVHSKEVSNHESRRNIFENATKEGVVGIKIDFVPKCTREWSNWYEATLRDAASFKLMIDFHGPVKPTGRDRTWPNELTREAVRGHEWHIIRYKRTLPPEHDCIIPFNRYIQGAADYTPTVFNPEELRGYTWSREVAQAIVFTSPFLCYADHPENYLNNPAVDIIKTIPSTWDETIVLPGSEIGKCAAFARRTGNSWFIGIINGQEKTDLEINLGFLNKGSFTMKMLEDQVDRNDSIIIGTKEVTGRDHLKLSIKPGGGFVARFEKK